MLNNYWRYESEITTRHLWRVRTEAKDRAVTLWCQEAFYVEDLRIDSAGGVEFHYSTGTGEPSFSRCLELDNRPCWHTVSSLMFDRYFESLVEDWAWDKDGTAHCRIFDELASLLDYPIEGYVVGYKAGYAGGYEAEKYAEQVLARIGQMMVEG